jgi:hypothetical protein
VKKGNFSIEISYSPVNTWAFSASNAYIGWGV